MHRDPRKLDPRQYNFTGFRHIDDLAEANRLLGDIYEEQRAFHKAQLLQAQRWWVRLACFFGFHGINHQRFVRRLAYYVVGNSNGDGIERQACPYCSRWVADPLDRTVWRDDRGDGPYSPP